MIVYHRSSTVVEHPDTLYSRPALDFGPGFYVTVIEEQAMRWCERFSRFGKPSILNSYTLDEDALSSFDVRTFESYSGDWLDFVIACRLGRDNSSHDVVRGGVANDRVFNTCELYFKGYIEREMALGRLRFERPSSQLCFRTQASIDACLTFMEAIVQ